MSSNEKKTALLGENAGTAAHKLRKSILFAAIAALGANICYRCAQVIDDIAQLSIEHKEAWQSAEKPREAFYDLNNIAFAHLSCNSRAASKPTMGQRTHGIAATYDKYNCRCDECKAAKSVKNAKRVR